MSVTQLKTCTKCGKTKPLDQFHKHKPSPDGRKPSCKECRRSYEKSRYAQDPDVRQRARERSSDFYHSPEGKRRAKAYAQKPEVKRRVQRNRQKPEIKKRYRKWGKEWRNRNPDYLREWRARNKDKGRVYTNRQRTENPDQHRANIAVNNAVGSGKMARVSDCQCTRCGQKAEHYHHHKGYDPCYWLDVVPVCAQCHSDIHQTPS